MVNDRFNLCKRSSPFIQCLRRELNHIRDNRDLNSKIHLAVNEYGLLIVNDGSCAYCKKAIHFIDNIDAKLVFANCAYDANEILSYLNQRNIKPIIPPKRNRLHQRGYKGFKEKKQ